MKKEIDLSSFFSSLRQAKGFLAKCTLIGMISGISFSLILPNEYTSSVVFIPTSSDNAKLGGNLGGLASLAGVNLGSLQGGSDIPPSLYPKVAASTKFKKALLDSKFMFEGEEISYRQYYNSIYRMPFIEKISIFFSKIPSLVKSIFQSQSDTAIIINDEIVFIDEEDYFLIKRLEKQISVLPNQKDGFVQLSFTMPDPILSAQMAKNVEVLLQNEVLNFKIQKSKDQLSYTEERFEEKKAEFEKVKSKLANFRDKNQNISSAFFQSYLQELESDYNFSFSIYSELAKQVEQARLQVKQDTPIFTVIQPVTVPLEKSSPRRPFIVITFALLGFLVAIGSLSVKILFS